MLQHEHELGAITRQTVIDTCGGQCRVHQEDFTLAMEQKLLHHYLLSHQLSTKYYAVRRILPVQGQCPSFPWINHVHSDTEFVNAYFSTL